MSEGFRTGFKIKNSKFRIPTHKRGVSLPELEVTRSAHTHSVVVHGRQNVNAMGKCPLHTTQHRSPEQHFEQVNCITAWNTVPQSCSECNVSVQAIIAYLTFFSQYSRCHDDRFMYYTTLITQPIVVFWGRNNMQYTMNNGDALQRGSKCAVIMNTDTAEVLPHTSLQNVCIS